MNIKEINKDYLDGLSDKELKELKTGLYNYYDVVRDYIRFKEAEPFKKDGKFIKITDFNAAYVTYMHVRFSSIDHSRPGYSDNDPCVTYTGHAFYSSFSDYADDNYAEWSTWKSVSILLRDLEQAEETRKHLGERTEENKWKYDCYSIVEITKEEFLSEFKKMTNRLINDCPEWIDYDEKEHLDKEKNSQSDINTENN